MPCYVCKAQNNRRTVLRTHRGKQQKLGFVGAKLLQRPARRRGFSELDVIFKWAEIVPAYAEYSRPIKLGFGVLSVETSGASVSYNMEMQGEALVSRINQFFGYGAVQKIRFINTGFRPNKEQVKPKLVADSNAKERAKERCLTVDDESMRPFYESLAALVEMENRAK